MLLNVTHVAIDGKIKNGVKNENIVNNDSEIIDNEEIENMTAKLIADMNDINLWPSLNEIYRTKSDDTSSAKKTETHRSKNKPKKSKWKKAPVGLLHFIIDLKVPCPVLDPRLLYTLDRELKCFDDSLDNINPGSTSSSGDLKDEFTAKGPDELKSSSDDLKGPDSETVHEEIDISDANEESVAYEEGVAYYSDEDLSERNEFCYPGQSVYKNRINNKICHKLEADTPLIQGQRLRGHKHKWKVMKAHKQIKTKHCRSIKNCTRGKNLYIKHRVKKVINLKSSRLTCIPNPRMTYKYIDKKLEREGVSLRGRNSCRHARINDLKHIVYDSLAPTLTTHSYNAHSALSDIFLHLLMDLDSLEDYSVGEISYLNDFTHNSPVAPRPVVHTLNAYNADGDLDAQLVNQLITMQDRDLTPEDYELLLELDNRVTPKTVQENILESFKKDTVIEADSDQMCSVCIENYVQGQVRKYLPCGHYFHVDCIDTWLKNSSMNCPLDGLSVEMDE